MHRLAWFVLLFAGCHSAMAQWSLGPTTGFAAGRTGGTAAFSAAVGDRTGAFGATARMFVTEDVALLGEELQLVAIGPRMDAVRLFGRIGLGFNIGWVRGDFGGGGALGGELGAMFGRRRCGPTVHVGAHYLGRGASEGEPFVAVSVGTACAHHAADPR